MKYSFSKYEKEDPNFISDLRESKKSVEVVADWLRSLGKKVNIFEVKERPSVEKMAEYADDGDLEIVDELNGSKRIEVKHRKSLKFSGLKDFPYKTIIVDVCHTFDNADPKPYAYVILNDTMTTALIVTTSSSEYWKKVSKRDRFKNRIRYFYECPVEHVKEKKLFTNCKV
jgi:hypothetical protein